LFYEERRDIEREREREREREMEMESKKLNQKLKRILNAHDFQSKTKRLNKGVGGGKKKRKRKKERREEKKMEDDQEIFHEKVEDGVGGKGEKTRRWRKGVKKNIKILCGCVFPKNIKKRFAVYWIYMWIFTFFITVQQFFILLYIQYNISVLKRGTLVFWILCTVLFNFVFPIITHGCLFKSWCKEKCFPFLFSESGYNLVNTMDEEDEIFILDNED